MMGLLDSMNDPMMGLAMGLLSAGGPSARPVSLGQALGQGYQGFQDAQKQQAMIQKQQQEAALQKMQLSEAQRKFDEKKRLDDALAAAMAKRRGTAQPQIQEGASQFSPPSFGAANPHGAGQASELPFSMADTYMEAAIRSGSSDAWDNAIKMKLEERKLAPKFKADNGFALNPATGKLEFWSTSDQTGKPEFQGVAPKPNMDVLHLGNRDLAINKDELKPGQTFGVGMSPDAAASNSLGWARFNNEKAQQTKPQFIESVGGYVAPPKDMVPGEVRKIPGIAKPLTEAQANANIFASRADEASRTLADLEGKYSRTGIALKNGLENTWGMGIPAAGVNMALGPKSQKAEQAQRDFVNAVLRKESGAAISESEFNNARRQYFPQPGDSAEVVEQKRKNREIEIAGLRTAAGPAAPAMAADIQPQANSMKSKQIKLDDGTAAIATLGGDGNYYVKRGGKTYRVEE